jgi:small subunit ribosomal protein S15
MEKEKKQKIISSSRISEADTGSTEVQVSLLTERINHLVQHLGIHVTDNHSRRGLFMLVGQRKRLLAYLSREDVSRYNNLITKLSLRK